MSKKKLYQFNASKIIIMHEQVKESYDYHITVLKIKMKVKLQCKMKVQYLGLPLTSQVFTNNDSIYIFNQQFALTDDQKSQCFQITISLITETGSKYLAGVVKLYHQEMIRSEGQTLVLSLSRCLDPQAFCEMRIDQVLRKPKNGIKSKQLQNQMHKAGMTYRSKKYDEMQRAPTMKNIHQKMYPNTTRTEYWIPMEDNVVSPPVWGTPKLQDFPQAIRSPRSAQQITKLSNDGDISASQDHLEIEGYRQAYIKLKQKYKQQSQKCKKQENKRVACENNEHTLQVQLMRYKMKIEEQERIVADRNAKIKESQDMSKMVRQKEEEINYLLQEMEKRNSNCHSLENLVQSLSNEVKKLNQDHQVRLLQIKQHQMQIEDLKIELESKQREVKYLARKREQMLKEKEKEINLKSYQIEQDRKFIAQIQNNLQLKTQEHQKLLQNKQNLNQQKVKADLIKIEELQKQLKSSLQEKNQMMLKIKQIELSFGRQQYEMKMINQQCQILRKECSQLKKKAEKYGDFVRQNKMLKQENSNHQKQLGQLRNDKEDKQAQIYKKFQGKVEYFKNLANEAEVRLANKDRRIKSLQDMLLEHKSQWEKIKKGLQLANQNQAQAKEKQIAAQRAAKAKIQEFLEAETEYATLKEKIKNIDQIYKLQADKIKADFEKTKFALGSQKKRTASLQEQCERLKKQLAKIQVQLSHTQQNAEKNSKSSKEKSIKIQEITKQYEVKISILEHNMIQLKTTEKQAVFKLQKIQLEALQKEDRLQKLKRDYKTLQQKYLFQEQCLKSRNADFIQVSQEKDSLQEKVNYVEHELAEIKASFFLSNSEKSRQAKIIEALQDQKVKSKLQLERLKQSFSQKVKNQQKLNQLCRNYQQQVKILGIKLSTIQKDRDNFKDQLQEAISKNLAVIFGRSTKLQKEQNSKDAKAQLNFHEIFAQLNAHFKQLRHFTSKQKQAIIKAETQRDAFGKERSMLLSQNQQRQFDLQNEIVGLEGELNKLIEQKKNESLNFTTIITQMKTKLSQDQKIQNQLHNQIQELSFTLSSVKMDYEALNDQNNKRSNALRKLNSELQEKNSENMAVIANLEQTINILSSEIELININLDQQLEKGCRNDKIIEELKETLQNHQQELQTVKRAKKEVTEKISQLEFHLSYEKQQNQKNQQLLMTQEAKFTEMKNFASNLMKEKEIAIKKEMQFGQDIINLESSLLQKNKNIQILNEQNERLTKNNETVKENNKVLANLNKELDHQLKELKLNYFKIQEKLKQKQASLQNKEDSLKYLQLKSVKTIDKLKNEINQLTSQAENNMSKYSYQLRVSKQNISQLQRELNEKSQNFQKIQKRNVQIEQTMFQQHQKMEQLQQSIQKHIKQIQELKLNINEQTSEINELNKQLGQKQEKMLDLSGKNFTLELKSQTEIESKFKDMQILQEQYIAKHQQICESYEHKIQILEKDIDYYKREVEAKDRDLAKKHVQMKNMQTHEVIIRKNFDDRMKNLQQDKISFASSKNIEIQRLSDENRSLTDIRKQRQMEVRRSGSELEVSRRQIRNLESKMKEFQYKHNSLVKQYQSEVEQLKKKQIQSKNFKENISTHLWSMQREVKKIVQGLVRNYLQISSQKDSNKVIDMMRSLENTILEAVTYKSIQNK